MKRLYVVLVLALVGAVLPGCDVATDPVRYDDFIKAEGEGEIGVWVHSGLYNRTYLLHTPPGLVESGSYPLAIFLHGAGGTGESFHRLLSADQVTDSAGFIAVYPDGLEGTWTVGCDECTHAEALKADDVTFLQTLSRHLAEHLPVDTSRVYLLGYSQGGSLAHLYGCRATLSPAGIAGVASLAYRALSGDCAPSRPFPVVSVHGTFDGMAYYNGYGLEAPLQPVPETLDMWRTLMGCDPAPVVAELPDTAVDFTTVTTFRYGGCQPGSGVMHYRVNEGGHTWPGPTGPWSRRMGSHNRDMDATREIFAYFAAIGSGGS